MSNHDTPEMLAMRQAMKAAEDAAEKRRLAKLAAAEAETSAAEVAGPAALDALDALEGDDWDVIAETSRAKAKGGAWPGLAAFDGLADDLAGLDGFGGLEGGAEAIEFHALPTQGDADVDALIDAAAASMPELDNVEAFGDLTIFRHDAQAAPWYQTAAEEAMPAALRGVKGPIDVKVLLQALIVEVGDVKRTNAILMETLSRLEEKVERSNRLLRDRRWQ